MAKPSFKMLWNSYPTVASPCGEGWDNQCAIRMSICLSTEGTILVSKMTYVEPKCVHGHARGAESLATWLWKRHLNKPKIYKDGAEKKAKADLACTNGIIFFKDCFTRSGSSMQTGDHIDLWRSGSTKTYDDPQNKSKEVWFWAIPW